MGFHEEAEKEGFYACNGWSPEDVICKADELGVVMTKEEAIEFLVNYRWPIVDAMVRAGWEAIEVCLSEEE